MTGNGIVLVAVVDQVTPRIQGQLESLLGEFYPGVGAGAAAPRLELLDRAASEMIERLISAGLLQPTARFSRPWPLGNGLDKSPPLSEEDCRRAATWRERCRHVVRRGRVLGQAGFADEARESVNEALHAIGRALAIEKRLPDPESMAALRESDYKFLWGSEGDMVQGFLQNSEVSWEPLVVVLERLAS